MSTEEIPSVLNRGFNSPLVSLPHSFPHSPDEAFAAKYMPDPGHDIKEFQVFSLGALGLEGVRKETDQLRV